MHDVDLEMYRFHFEDLHDDAKKREHSMPAD